MTRRTRRIGVEAAVRDDHIERMKQALLLAVMGFFLVAVFWGVFHDFNGSAMNIHGWIALGIGAVLSLALGIGLMMLVFYSARRGYDDRIARDEPEDRLGDRPE